jgi:hypothetical protein
MMSGGMIHIQSIMKIGSGIQAILRLLAQQFERLRCWHYWWEGLVKYFRYHDIHTKFNQYRYKRSKVVR